MINLNKYTRGKTLIKGRLFFGGGSPRDDFKLPYIFRWGPNLSIVWLGTELVIRLIPKEIGISSF